MTTPTQLIGWAVLLAAAAMVTRAAAEVPGVEWVCEKHPQRVQALFDSLDLARKGMEAVKAAAGRNDWPEACRGLLAYYRRDASGSWLRRDPVKPTDATDPAAEKILKDLFTFYSVEGKVPRLKSGGLDWACVGPNKDAQWRMALNRHAHLRVLLRAYFKTGKAAYARCINDHLRDWARVALSSGRRRRAAWGTSLDVASRARVWPAVFFGLGDVEALAPATRILMLSLMLDHARQLRARHRHRSNWTTMEMSGLAAVAAAWGELKESAGWLKYAAGVLTREMTGQVLPDGVQHELTSGYHWVALRMFEHLAGTLRHAGAKVPAKLSAGIEKMWNYLTWSMRPDGHNPLNNDSDLRDLRPEVLRAAETYQRPDWQWIATNGKAGKAPPGPPSIVFPHAGQLIMRSGFDADAHWGFFDAGPLGAAHVHYDKLHLSVSAFGRDLLVDGGRYTYRHDAFRRHFVSSRAHNVVLIDGRGQRRYRQKTPLPAGSYAVEPAFDYARGRYDGGFDRIEGKAVHTRAVMYVRGRFWVVVDRIESDRPRKVQALWHYHPACTVAARGTSVTSTDAGKGNLRIVPVSDLPWKVKVVKGRASPAVQGWYSPRYNVKQPSPAAVYSAAIGKAATFAWVLLPARGEVRDVDAELVVDDAGVAVVRTADQAGEIVEAVVPLGAGKPRITPGPGQKDR